MAKSQTVKLYFDGVLEECLVRTDADGEFIVKARSGRVLKFPADSDLKEEVKRHNANPANKETPVLAEEVDTSVDEEWENWDKPAADGDGNSPE